MRLLGIILVAGACTGIGFLATGRLRRETSAMEQLIVLLECAAAYIRCQSPELCDLLSLLAEDCGGAFRFPAEVSRSLAPGVPPAGLWCEAVRKDPGVPAAARDILCSLGSVLGTTDKAGQLAALALHRDRLLKAAGESRERCQRQGKLYRSLGLLGGTMAAVLLL
ncbi:MAG: stage III sporulation protein AB [Oscillospiraceae bacterium]|nr:stage III sporulation protein AB [Oscillospiraceae bacterium]